MSARFPCISFVTRDSMEALMGSWPSDYQNKGDGNRQLISKENVDVCTLTKCKM